MKNTFTILVGAVIVLLLVAYMFVFQVRYDEVAIKTTFDRATDDSIIKEPGLKMRAPWPFQKVTKYSTRLQFLEDQLDEQQTADGKAVIMRTYVAWRVENPLRFFRTVEDFRLASERLSPLIRNLRGVISEYSFDQLVNTDPAKVKLAEIEDKTAAILASSARDTYGIEIVRVGIRRIVLPEKTTESVFETMKKTRERMAENARQEGQAQAAAIRSDAQSASRRMLAFAERYAQEIRARGDREAAEHYAKFAADEDFASFLFQIRALERMLKNNTTFVLDANSLDALEWFQRNPTVAPASPAVATPAATTPRRTPPSSPAAAIPAAASPTPATVPAAATP